MIYININNFDTIFSLYELTIFVIINEYVLLASFPHPIGQDCSTEKEGGSNREFAELETDQGPQSPARGRAIHWKHTSACECKPTFLHSLPLA